VIIEIIVNTKNNIGQFGALGKKSNMLKLYSTECPACKMVVKVLEDKNIEFEKITDEAEVLACADRYEINNVPFAITSDGVVLNSSVEIIDFANKGN
jgi:glutaredoxin